MTLCLLSKNLSPEALRRLLRLVHPALMPNFTRKPHQPTEPARHLSTAPFLLPSKRSYVYYVYASIYNI